MTATKPTHTLILDSGPIIKNEPPVSSLLASSESLVTTPSVISEIRDATTRSRVETLLTPFLTLRQPKPSSLQFVAQFARKTGDYAVLSKTDLEIIALGYEIECERNLGDWRLRNAPGQKRMNGSPPKELSTAGDSTVEGASASEQTLEASSAVEAGSDQSQKTEDNLDQLAIDAETTQLHDSSAPASTEPESRTIEDLSYQTAELEVTPSGESKLEEVVQSGEQDQLAEESIPEQSEEQSTEPLSQQDDQDERSNEDSDSDGGWITPSNFKKHQAQEADGVSAEGHPQKVMQAAIITTDFPMQNVILQMNLNLLSTSLARVRNIKSFILRCHACFGTTRDMTKQFCPRCGGPTLTKVTCSTNSKGEFQLHLKKNFQWNKRGDRYSIPKLAAGSPHGRIQGGGKGGWGNELMLAEDQKEYMRAVTAEKRQKKKDILDDEFLPGILTGHRNTIAGRPKVGAGRNVNSKKRN